MYFNCNRKAFSTHAFILNLNSCEISILIAVNMFSPRKNVNEMLKQTCISEYNERVIDSASAVVKMWGPMKSH